MARGCAKIEDWRFETFTLKNGSLHTDLHTDAYMKPSHGRCLHRYFKSVEVSLLDDDVEVLHIKVRREEKKRGGAHSPILVCAARGCTMEQQEKAGPPTPVVQ